MKHTVVTWSKHLDGIRFKVVGDLNDKFQLHYPPILASPQKKSCCDHGCALDQSVKDARHEELCYSAL